MSFDDNNNNGCIKLNNGKMILRAHRAALLASVCLGVIAVSSQAFAEVKALSLAINHTNSPKDTVPVRNYMGQNGIDFGVFDFSKSDSYFINSAFANNGRNFKATYFYLGDFYKFIVYNSDRYGIVNTPSSDSSGNNIAAVFEDEFGDRFALISLRGSYSASSVKSYIDGIVAKYPTAKLIVTYNARVETSNAETLNASLTTDPAGPQMTCLGRTEVDGTAIGGVYMYSSDVPDMHSVTLVPKSIGTVYDGTLATLEFPVKYKVVFNDWDGTGLQTNIVFAGESVTPPTVPGRDGYTFTRWDHADSEFESVSESFTATAQYASNAAWLHVSGDPENIGTADPAYGAITEISANDTFTATISNPAVEEDATERWVCTGYTHYEINNLATGAKTVAQEGNGSSFSYTHVMHDELVWHFTNEWLVSASASQGGSVSISESWVRNGDTLQLVATPEEGYSLWRWDGDTDGIADVTSASIEVSVTSARSLRAIFAPHGADASVQYVATTGDDANDGYSAVSPKLTIQAAVDTLAAAPGYGTVHVASGMYQTTTDPGVAITNAIAVFGDTGNPEDVVLRNKSGNNRVLLLNHPAAFVANVVVENGCRYQSTSYGANIAIESNGGTVSNSVIRGGSWAGMYVRGLGAWLNSANALITHCVITNNAANGASQQPGDSGDKAFGGLFVDIAKGTVANCLIANNRDTGDSSPVANWRRSQTCGVTVRDGGRLMNCTVVTNEARYTGGIFLYPGGYATNVVVAGCVNKCTYTNSQGVAVYTDVGFSGTIANASHCASDGGDALDETCVAGTAAGFFRSMADCDYRPALDSPLINAGIAYEGIASFDLLGKKRVQGRAPDIGCFESAPSGLSVIIR